MGLTSSLYTALSGLNVNQLLLDVTGNNIANVNTTAFKASSVSFESQFSQTFSFGASPSGSSGGSNPTQSGLGAVSGPIERNMAAGTFETTGVTTDLAIDGSGWFVVRQADGSTAYTRDGSFVTNADNDLVTGDGNYVLGYQVDDNFNIIPGSLGKLALPVGQMTVAGATSAASFTGDLNSSGVVATTGAILQTQDLTDTANHGAAITAASLLSDVQSGGSNIFDVGDTLTLNTSVGGRTLPSSSFTIAANSKVSDLETWLTNSLGINTTAGLEPPPGVTVNASGQIVVTGNIGTVNDLNIAAGNLTSSNAANFQPLTFTKTASANGESVYSSALFYDSLGTQVNTGISLVLANNSSQGNTWQMFVDSPDATTANPAIGTGTLTFGDGGQLVSSTGTQVAIDRANTGAQSPMNIQLNFGGLTALAASSSSLTMSTQNGFPEGTLADYAIGNDGTITGTFTNGLTKTLGQISLATFANDSGLVSQSQNLFTAGPNSGTAFLQAPSSSSGAGSIASGALELSNVDISQEFVNLIVASTGYSAASRVISTCNDLLTELLQIVHQ